MVKLYGELENEVIQFVNTILTFQLMLLKVIKQGTF